MASLCADDVSSTWWAVNTEVATWQGQLDFQDSAPKVAVIGRPRTDGSLIFHMALTDDGKALVDCYHCGSLGTVEAFGRCRLEALKLGPPCTNMEALRENARRMLR